MTIDWRFRFLPAVAVCLVLPLRAGTLLAVFAHPDDETTIGAMLAKYAAKGHAVHLVSVTSGQRGFTAHSPVKDGEVLGKMREEELRAAARELGVREPILLRFEDGQVAARSDEVARRIRDVLDQVVPDVVVTYGRDGVTGHGDHIAVGRITTELIARGGLRRPPRKLYHIAFPETLIARRTAMKATRLYGVPEETVTTHVEAARWRAAAARAVLCHKTQWTQKQAGEVSEMAGGDLGGTAWLRLAWPEPAGGLREDDVFAGLQ